MAHPLQQGTDRVSVFTGSTAKEGGTQVSDSNPFPVKIGDGSNTALVNDEGQLHVVLMGKVDDSNSTSTLLNSGQVFTGTAFNTLDYGFIFVTIFSDVASATDGLSFQQSPDGTNWDNTDDFNYLAGTGKTYSIQPGAEFFRIVYTNGSTNQSEFRMQTIFKKTSSLPSSHRVSDTISPEDDATLGISVIKGQKPNGDYTDFSSTTSGNFKVSVEEIQNKISTNNSTTDVLSGDAVFTGPADDISNFANVTIQLDSSHDSATDGMTFQFSTDNTNWDDVYTFTYTASEGARRFQLPCTAQYFRMVYTNGSTLQTHFRVQIILHVSDILTSIHRLQDDTSPDRSLELTKSALISRDNSTGNFKVIDAGNPLPVRDPLLEIARGKVIGEVSINKFGRNIEVDSAVTADIWDGGHNLSQGGVSLIWVAPTQARIHAIVSTSNNDSDTGGVNPQSDGARTIRVFGLTDWDTKEVSEDIIMDGTTEVNTNNSYVIIHRILVLTKGANSSGPNVGVITATAATDGTITAQIRESQGQTQMSIYGVPSVQKAEIGRLYANVNKSGGAAGLVDVSLQSNPEPDSELTNFLTKHTFGLQTVGTSAFTITYYAPKVVEGPAIIKIQVSSNTNDMDVSAGFDLILTDV